MRIRATWRNLTVVAAVIAMALAACGGDDSGNKTGSTGNGKGGGTLVDGATFSAAAPPHIDPALTSELDGAQVTNAVYDGLTDIDYTDPQNPVVKGQVAESYEPNADATVWTFKIRDGQTFSNGEPVLPSSFVRGWERAARLAGDYSYLIGTFIKGGQDVLDKKADSISGVQADDENMTLTVELTEPYANFDAVAGFQLFDPMPKAVDDLKDQNQWENGIMIGNGPYKMVKARNDQEIVLERNDRWAGDIFGNKRPIVDKIVFKISKDIDSAYNAMEAGDFDTANIPSGRVKEAEQRYGTTLDVRVMGSYHFDVNMDDPVVGGPDNKLLRQAISQAINRDEINEAVYEGTRTTSTGITPPGIPGFKANLCKYCAYDKAAAQKAFDDWKAAGHSLSKPVDIVYNTDAGHEPVVQIIVDNLKAVGIDAKATPIDSEVYFSQLRDGACVICRAGWYADYPTYDNFLWDLFSKPSIGGNNLGPYHNDRFDELVIEAKKTIDKEEAGRLYNEAEEILLNDDIGVIPINWYRGDYVYRKDRVTNFPQTPNGFILWEQVTLK
jgi:oligopeptide transport system substrate-binding protein